LEYFCCATEDKSQFPNELSAILKKQPSDGNLINGVLAYLDNPEGLREFYTQHLQKIREDQRESDSHRYQTIIQNAEVFISKGAFEQLQRLASTVSDFETLFQIWQVFEFSIDSKPNKEMSICVYRLTLQLQTLANDDEQLFRAYSVEFSWHTHPQNAYKQADSDKQAIALLDKLEKLKPYSEIYQTSLLLQKGRLLTQLHDFENAQNCYIDALKLGTKHSSIGDLLFWIIFEGGMLSALRNAKFSQFLKAGAYRGYFAKSELDVKVQLEEEFWHYFAYSYQNAKPIGRQSQNDELITEAVKLAVTGQYAEFDALLRRKFNKKPNKKMTGTRADTLLTFLIKLLNNQALNSLMLSIESLKTIETPKNLIIPPHTRSSILRNRVAENIKRVERNIKRAIKILLKKVSVNVNYQDFKGQAALHFAAANGQIDIMNALLEKGADIDIGDYKKRTLLRGAVIYREKKVAELLLNKGVKNSSPFYGQILTNLSVYVER